jgi:sirohydrochlorin ferrochelatase
MKTGLLLIAHGSRNAAANDDLEHVAAALRERGEFAHVVAAFLEIAEPSIPQGGQQCVSAGMQRVVLVPYFLSAGVHVREDLRRFRAELAALHREVEFVLAEPLGRHPLLLDVVLERVGEALGTSAASGGR